MNYSSADSFSHKVWKVSLLTLIVAMGLLSVVGSGGGGGGNGEEHGTLKFSSATYSAIEGTDPTVTVTVTRTGGSGGAASVDYATADGTADSTDYTAASGTLNWADGDAVAKTFTVAITDDSVSESSQSFTVALSNVVTATLGTPNTATITITDDDNPGTLQFSSTTYSGTEGTDPTVTITVTRSGGTVGAVAIDYATSDNTANDGSDYTAASGTLSWADGVGGAQIFTVAIINDTDVEVPQTVNLTLSNPTGGATLGTPSTATLTITSEDSYGTLQFTTTGYTVNETDGTVTNVVALQRVTGSSGAVSVDVSDLGTGSADGLGTDYSFTSPTTVSWAHADTADKFVTIIIENDVLDESDETVDLSLGNVTGGAIIGTPSTATLTINDDDGAVVACASTADDSVQTLTGWIRIRSESFGIYGLETLTRQTLGTGPSITMDYMVHEPPGVPSALVVLIAGGQLDASIVGTIGSPPTNAGGNFLVRSAHLFAAQGYRVLTIDRPSDYLDYTLGSGSGSAYDGYRTSMEHAVDLSQLINVVNAADNLPVIIAGTSRGTISAVVQHALGSALAISAPLTSGGGTPIGTGNVLPSSVPEPVQVSWHVLDTCNVTKPADSQSLVGDFSDATGVAISGGFKSASSTSACDADDYHGFPGIESCAVKQETDWMAVELAGLPATRPVASAQSDSTTQNTQKLIDLTGFATAAAGGALTYSLPHTSSSLGGTISIAGTSVTYTPPSGVASIIDTFVYLVSEAGGGTSHNVIAVTINP